MTAACRSLKLLGALVGLLEAIYVWPNITGNPPRKAISIGVSYISFFITEACFRMDVLGSALVEFISKDIEKV